MEVDDDDDDDEPEETQGGEVHPPTPSPPPHAGGSDAAGAQQRHSDGVRTLPPSIHLPIHLSIPPVADRVGGGERRTDAACVQGGRG